MQTLTTIHLEPGDTVEAVGPYGPEMLRLAVNAAMGGTYLTFGSSTGYAALRERVALCDAFLAALGEVRADAASRLEAMGAAATPAPTGARPISGTHR